VLDGVGVEAGALGCGGRRSAGGVAGTAIPETCTGVAETTTGAGSGAACALPAVALRTAKLAPNTTSTTTSAAIAARPREDCEVELMRGARSSAAAPGHSQRSGRLEPGARQRWTLVKLAWPILYSMYAPIWFLAVT
jgi:hypothetical protein